MSVEYSTIIAAKQSVIARDRDDQIQNYPRESSKSSLHLYLDGSIMKSAQRPAVTPYSGVGLCVTPYRPPFRATRLVRV